MRGMMANRHLARSIADMGFHECRRQLEYKAALRGGVVIVADRWFASSKTCSGCGLGLNRLPLAVRTWTCSGGGMAHDRDVNAALNLKNYAVSSRCLPVEGKALALAATPRRNRPREAGSQL